MTTGFNPLVSVIIPVYNGSDFLKEAIDSALNQTYKNVEVLVINDGSNDNGKTEAIALTYGSRIRYISKPNGGVASALNEGIKNMKGDFFSWLSHDDVYYPYKIEIQITYLLELQDKESIVFSNCELIDRNGRHLYSENIRKYKTINSLSAVFYQALNGCAMLIPKKCFNENMFDENLKTTQDYELWLRLAKKYDFFYVNRIILKSRFHSNQGSRKIATHYEEANNTLIKSIDELTETEVLSFNKAVALFYIKMAIFYKSMGYKKACKHVWTKFKKIPYKLNFALRIKIIFLRLELLLTPLIQFLLFAMRLLFFNFNWYAFFYIATSTIKKRCRKS